MKTKKRRRALNNKEFESAAESSFQPEETSQNNMQETVHHDGQNTKIKRQRALSVMRNTDDETIGVQITQSNNLAQPYEFLQFANPSLHMIFFPHFTVKSVTFGLSVLLLILFIVLLIFNYTKTQNDFTWNCSLYQLQNKFFPKLRYSFQFWRVPISGFFHSNIAHFCLNILGLQLYGYFIEWYYGKLKLTMALIITIIVAHFFAAAVNNESVSTMSSSLLYCIIALKLWFLFEYRNYKPLQFRRVLIFVLLGLIIGINLIPIFTANNVDFASHLGGFIVGGLIGTFFHFRKKQQKHQHDEKLTEYPKIFKGIKWGSLVLIAIFFVACVAAVFATDTETLYLMNSKIDEKCQS